MPGRSMRPTWEDLPAITQKKKAETLHQAESNANDKANENKIIKNTKDKDLKVDELWSLLKMAKKIFADRDRTRTCEAETKR